MRFLFLTLRAYAKLIVFDLYLIRGDLQPLYKKVREYPCAKDSAADNVVEEICAAVNMACIWYRKQVQCLQLSAATVCLLRDAGVQAQFVNGVQQTPFKSHAWVEVAGRVVNDKPYLPELYAVVDRW